MEDLRQELEPVHDARAGPVEVAGPIDGEDATVLYRRKLAPLGRERGAVNLRDGLLEMVATGHQHHDLGPIVGDLSPGDRVGRPAGPAEAVGAAGHLHHAGHPVSADHDRVEPLHAEDSGPVRDGAHGRGYPLHALSQPRDDVAGLRLASGDLAEALDGVEHLL